ncbi:MAG: NAD-dependent protein deacylase [Pseudomonadales bacterium]|nr:NAD-dependent protein deacylase [Pseudomonadales bacterium]
MVSVSQYNNIVVLTGAGISAESGLKTFRDHDGLWEGHRVEDVATVEAFLAKPDFVQDFYNQRRRQLLSAQVHCNAAHRALANFEREFDGSFMLVTQNVDNLHQRAGSNKLLPMHGELLKARCTQCNAVSECRRDLGAQSRCPQCNSQGALRPHIVWFGEVPLHMPAIERALQHCDLFVSIGTSSVVYPAAGFAGLARQAGAKTVELNLEPGSTASGFDEAHYGPATKVVPDYFEQL